MTFAARNIGAGLAGSGFQGTVTSTTSGTTVGFVSGVQGSISPTVNNDSYAITRVSSDNVSFADTLKIQASPDPTQSYFVKATVAGVDNTSASASYSYSGGVATWTWATGAWSMINGTASFRIT